MFVSIFCFCLLQVVSTINNESPSCFNVEENPGFGQTFHIETPSQKFLNFEVSFCDFEATGNPTSRKAYLTTCNEQQIPPWIQLTCPRRNGGDFLKFEVLSQRNDVGQHCIKVSLLPLANQLFKSQTPSCIVSFASPVSNSTFMAVHKDNLASLLSFTVEINVRKPEPLEEFTKTRSCESSEVVTTASVYIDVNLEILNMSTQLMLLKKFSTFLGLSMTSLLIKISSDPPYIEQEKDLLRSGLGNKKEKSSEEITSLSWIVGCGSIYNSFEPPLTLLDKTAHHILGNNIGSDILFWRVYNIALNPELNTSSHSFGNQGNAPKQHQYTQSNFETQFMNFGLKAQTPAMNSQEMPGDEPEDDGYEEAGTPHKHFHVDQEHDYSVEDKILLDVNEPKPSEHFLHHQDVLPTFGEVDSMGNDPRDEDMDESDTNKMVDEDVAMETTLESNMDTDVPRDLEEIIKETNSPYEDRHHHRPTNEHRGNKKHRTNQNKHLTPKINKLELLRISAGSILKFPLPIDIFKGTKPKDIDLLFLTFTESASELSRKNRVGLPTKLSKQGHLKNQLSETIGVPPNSWIKLNHTTLYGLPLEEHIGKHRYIIAILNKKILSKFELEIEVEMRSNYQLLSHEFEVTIKDLDYKRAAQDVFLRIDLIKKISFAFGDKNLQNILMTGMFPGSVKITWSNLSLPVTPCPSEELVKLTKYILKNGPEDSQASDNFVNALKPHSISFVRFLAKGSCKSFFSGSLADAPTLLDLNSDEIQIDPVTNEENVTTLLYIMIPMVAIAAFLLIVLLTCVCCYIFGNSRRPGFIGSNNNEAKELTHDDKTSGKKSGAGNCVPIIFANELKSPAPAFPARPVLADQVCPRTPPPTYTHSINMTDSAFNASLKSHRYPLECSFSGNSNSFFSGSSHNESENSLRDVKSNSSKQNDNWVSGKRAGSKGDFNVRNEALNNYL